MKKQHNYTVMHWGTWQVESSEGEIVAVKPVPWDKNPSRIGQSLPDAVTSQTRIRRPAVRAGYLQHGPASREGRGKEPFVEVSWEVALDLLARELRSVKARCGNEAIYGGSYGWASAGRFHHAQSQLHRFLKGFGGYTASTNTYSSAAGERILPHILGPLSPLHRQHTHFSELARECQLFVAIGGLPLRNAQVNGGGANDHMLQYWLDKMQANGTRFINISPVARLSDMLLHPGETYEFDGQQRRYPDIRLVYWAGGNAFHHHQDLNRLCEAWRRPETVVVHEQYWTAQAKFSDIVLPATTSLEREDIGSGGHDGFMIAMSAQIPPVGEARDDYAIFCDLAGRLGFGEAFSEGRDAGQWLRHLYEESRPRAQEEGIALPSFDDFWQQGVLEYSAPERPQIFLADFRADPQRYPLSTPSGKIELFSATVAGFGYRECPGHPWWDEQEAARQRQEAARWPLHLLSSQPRARLHSQYDHGSVSRATKVQGREPLWMHPSDAQGRDIREGSVVKVYNDRGAILAGVHLSEQILPGVVQMSTGAWYDPLDPKEERSLDKHGNPNVLTEDRGSSRLGQGCSAQSCWVEIAPWREELPPITAFDPPKFIEV